MAITKQTDFEVDQIRVRVRRGGVHGGISMDGGRRRGRGRVTEGQSDVGGSWGPSKRAKKDPVPNETAKKGHPMEQDIPNIW
ncbi:hypothetical protein CR513_50335, partial [Mucuna pruriens]